MSGPRVLRWLADAFDVLPEALARLACGGLALLFVGGCTVVMIKHEPMYGVVLGSMALIAILPETLRWIANAVERRATDAPDERSDIPDRPKPSEVEPLRRRRNREGIDPRDFTEDE